MAKAKSAASPLMKRHRIAAALLAEGLSVQEVALRAGCDVVTLHQRRSSAFGFCHTVPPFFVLRETKKRLRMISSAAL